MKLTTAGESHGKMLIAILEGVPSKLNINSAEINRYLALRQGGYGRGGRQKIEKDEVEILSGVRGGVTLGSPITLAIRNRDYENWSAAMDAVNGDLTLKQVTAVRPGHADLTGAIKFGHGDARNVLERASARETAIRVAAGTVARQYLRELGVEVTGYVKSVGDVRDDKEYDFDELEKCKNYDVYMPDGNLRESAKKLIDGAKSRGDTLGGVLELRVKGLKRGFGSCMTYGEKLDGILCAALMSVQAIKGVEVGLGFKCAELHGSAVHDAIYAGENGYYRKTNNAGGIEGGMSNGEEIVLRAAMKPIPTLMRGLDTVDIATGKACTAASERSDVCAVSACEIVLESALCFALAEVVAKRLGGDNMDEVKGRYRMLPN